MNIGPIGVSMVETMNQQRKHLALLLVQRGQRRLVDAAFVSGFMALVGRYARPRARATPFVI
jgi:hypothetical protein